MEQWSQQFQKPNVENEPKAVENLLVSETWLQEIANQKYFFYADTVCLTNSSWFISQPLEQNSTLQAEFPPQFLKLTKHKSCSKNISLGIHAWDEEYIGNGDEGGQNLSHFGSRGWFHFWKTYEPAMGMWSVPFCFSISTNNFISGMDSKGDSCCSMTCYW